MGMSYLEIHNAAKNVAQKEFDAETLAAKLLQEYWRSMGHKGNVSDLECYPAVLDRVTGSIKGHINSIGEFTQSYITKLDYGMYSTGKYQLVGGAF